MILTLKVARPAKLREDLTFSPVQVRRLADVVQQGQLRRIGQGLDNTDAPMKEISEPYKRRKMRRGLAAKRDIKFTGNTLRALQVLDSDEGGFTIGFDPGAPATAHKRAHFRQIFDGFFGLSPRNAVEFDRELEDVFTELYMDAFEEAA